MDATAFSLRKTLFYMQTYAIDITGVTKTTRDFINGINKVIQDALPGTSLGHIPAMSIRPCRMHSRHTWARICSG
jgi:hypothetical protein